RPRCGDGVLLRALGHRQGRQRVRQEHRGERHDGHVSPAEHDEHHVHDGHHEHHVHDGHHEHHVHDGHLEQHVHDGHHQQHVHDGYHQQHVHHGYHDHHFHDRHHQHHVHDDLHQTSDHDHFDDDVVDEHDHDPHHDDVLVHDVDLRTPEAAHRERRRRSLHADDDPDRIQRRRLVRSGRHDHRLRLDLRRRRLGVRHGLLPHVHDPGHVQRHTHGDRQQRTALERRGGRLGCQSP